MKAKFPDLICVRREHEAPDPDLLLVGTPADVGQLDADDGDLVAIYRLDRVMTFHANPTLDPLGTNRPKGRAR